MLCVWLFTMNRNFDSIAVIFNQDLYFSVKSTAIAPIKCIKGIYIHDEEEIKFSSKEGHNLNFDQT